MSLFVGLHVYKVLKEDEDISSAGATVFPIIKRSGVDKFPFVEFDCSTAAPDKSYDGVECDNHRVTVRAIAKGYETAVALAESVRYALDGREKVYDTFEVDSAEFESCEEDYLQELDAYMLTMVFAMTTVGRDVVNGEMPDDTVAESGTSAAELPNTSGVDEDV